MASVAETSGGQGELVRSIDWRGAFWVASGVPALVLFSIGGIAGTVGVPAFIVWTVSILFGFVQSFTYAEISGMFPNKSGGAAAYGAAAWLRYSKWVAPLSVWSYWYAWSPVLSLGCAIAAGYVLSSLAPLPAQSEITAYVAAHAGSTPADAATALEPTLRKALDLYTGSVGPIGFSINGTFIIGAILMLVAFAIQHRGILGTAKVTKILGLCVIIPMIIVAVVPILTGKVSWDNFAPFVPLKAAYAPDPGAWNTNGWTLILGGLFIAAWSTYGFETAICYTSEFKDPEKDTFKAIFYSGLLCLLLFILVPFTFQGVLGLTGMLDPTIADGSGVADAMANMVGGGAIIHAVMVLLMIVALMLSIITAMAGSSRTLYQASRDGWLPKYLSRVNHHGAPVYAMVTDLAINLVVLAIAATDATSFFFILAVSNCGYILFNFLDLNAGWIHRLDSGHVKRPYRAANWLLGLGAVAGFVNLVFMGAGAKVWGPTALWYGIGFAAVSWLFFGWRHYITDKGVFPAQMLADLGLKEGDLGHKKAGMWPYLTLAAGIVVVLVSNWAFQLS
jgi:amino acid transporter